VLRRPLESTQYTSLAFGKTLRDSRLVASMGRRGDAYDNAACESFISTIKNELIRRRSWTSRDQARLAIFSYIETFYNPRRRHSALDYQSPNDYENIHRRRQPPLPPHSPQVSTETGHPHCGHRMATFGHVWPPL
jgi:putative transposase